jgi:hypothetical protein
MQFSRMSQRIWFFIYQDGQLFVMKLINPLLALTYQNVLDLNVACRAKRTQTYWQVRKFKCPLKKSQPACPCSRDLNWTGKRLNQINTVCFHPAVLY